MFSSAGRGERRIEGQLLDGHVHRIPGGFNFDDKSPVPVAAVIKNAGILIGEVLSVVDPPLLADPDVGVVHELGDDRAVELAPLVLEAPRHDVEELLAAVEKDGEKGGDFEHADNEDCWRFGRARKHDDAPGSDEQARYALQNSEDGGAVEERQCGIPSTAAFEEAPAHRDKCDEHGDRRARLQGTRNVPEDGLAGIGCALRWERGVVCARGGVDGGGWVKGVEG